MLRAMPVRRWNSVNERAPSIASRTTRRLHLSPTRSSVRATGQSASVQSRSGARVAPDMTPPDELRTETILPYGPIGCKLLLIGRGTAMGVWRRLLLAMVCGVAVASIYAAQPVLEPMGRDLGVSAGLAGWIVAAGQAGYLAGLVLL